MSMARHETSRTRSVAPAPARLLSLDVFRGFVILSMVFVNSLGGMAGVPGWTQHAASNVDMYTFTDCVFPSFLFMVGVAIPFSLSRYFIGEGAASAMARLLPRVLGLLVLGVIYVNEDRFDEKATGMAKNVWMVLAQGAALVLWGTWRGRLGAVVRGIAAAGLLALLFMWRGDVKEAGHPFLTPSWWGILGIIGWAYLVSAVVYLLVRGEGIALMGILALEICVYIGFQAGRKGFLAPLDSVWGVDSYFGSTSAIVTAGMIVGGRLRERKAAPLFLLLFGLGLWASGWLLRPLHGYHKDSGTESWSLVTAGLACLGLLVCHLALDRGKPGEHHAAEWLALVGRNALFAYILSEGLGDLASLAHVDLMPYWGRGGGPGMVNAGAVTLGVAAVTAVTTRLGYLVRL